MLFFSKCLCGYKLLLLCFFIISSLHTSAASLKAAREEQGQAGFLGTSVPGRGLRLCWWCLQVELQDDQATALHCFSHAGAMVWLTACRLDFLASFLGGHSSCTSYHMLQRYLGLVGSLSFSCCGHWELGYNQSCVPLCALREPGQGFWWAIF